MVELKTVKIKKKYVGFLRDRKIATGVPIATSIELAIDKVYGKPKEEKKQPKK